MMTLEQAIEHTKNVAASKCDECGKEHQQLAEWLTELQSYKDKTHINGEFLIRNGFTKRANDYLYQNGDVEITAKLLFAENNCWYVYIGFTDHSEECESLLIYTVGQLRLFLAIEGLNNIKI